MKDDSLPLEIDNLRKTFRDFWGRPRVEAVRGVSLSVKPGEIVGLLGPNGSGKSTTIKTALGLLRPSGGSVRLFGLSPRSAAARAKVGYLPEISNLHRFLSPLEALEYHGGLLGMSSSEVRSLAPALLRRVGLSDEATRRPAGEFSKGMARRAGLAQALLGDPALVVLDEPTSGLDPVGRHEVKQLVRELASEGRAVLLSSHLLAEVQDVCDRVAILVDGTVCAEGALADLLARDDAVRFCARGLPPDAIEKFRAALEAEAKGGVEIDRPSRPLEDYFLSVLRRVRAPADSGEGRNSQEAGR